MDVVRLSCACHVKSTHFCVGDERLASFTRTGVTARDGSQGALLTALVEEVAEVLEELVIGEADVTDVVETLEEATDEQGEKEDAITEALEEV